MFECVSEEVVVVVMGRTGRERERKREVLREGDLREREKTREVIWEGDRGKEREKRNIQKVNEAESACACVFE